LLTKNLHKWLIINDLSGGARNSLSFNDLQKLPHYHKCKNLSRKKVKNTKIIFAK